jgi:hypothetical protein
MQETTLVFLELQVPFIICFAAWNKTLTLFLVQGRVYIEYMIYISVSVGLLKFTLGTFAAC